MDVEEKIGMSHSARLTKKQAILLIQTKCPKFTKIQLCMVNNPDYGVALSAKAKSCLKEEKQIKRKKQNKLSVYVDDVDKESVKRKMEEHGCKTVQEYLEYLVRNDVR